MSVSLGILFFYSDKRQVLGWVFYKIRVSFLLNQGGFLALQGVFLYFLRYNVGFYRNEILYSTSILLGRWLPKIGNKLHIIIRQMDWSKRYFH